MGPPDQAEDNAGQDHQKEQAHQKPGGGNLRSTQCHGNGIGTNDLHGLDRNRDTVIDPGKNIKKANRKKDPNGAQPIDQDHSHG